MTECKKNVTEPSYMADFLNKLYIYIYLEHIYINYVLIFILDAKVIYIHIRM